MTVSEGERIGWVWLKGPTVIIIKEFRERIREMEMM
jgi:hypothetical protein